METANASLLHTDFTLDKLISVIKSIKCGKSVGHDSIPSKIL